MSITLDRIMQSVPDYYGTSRVYQGIQAAKAAEWDRLEGQQDDLALQLHLETATWGLRYWEEGYNIPTVVSDSYEIRRSRVMAKRRSPGNFSAKLIKSVSESFVNGQVSVKIDFDTGQVTVTFTGVQGIPPNLPDLKAAIDGIIHAHLGVAYIITATVWDIIDGGNVAWNTADTYLWDDFEKAAF